MADIESTLLMRAITSFIGIIALLFGFNAGPFFHIHVEGDDSHGPNHETTLHAHFFDLIPESSSSAPEIEDDHHHHRGTEVPVIVASGRRAQGLAAELRGTHWTVETSVLAGYGIDVPMRTHDPPDRRNFAPRAPPA